MSARDPVYGHGPYSVADMANLRDEGKGFELVDGWLIERSTSPRHDYVVYALRDIVESAAKRSGADIYIQAPMDIPTPSGARKPDVVVVSRTAARDAWHLNLSLFPGTDVQLAIEVVSRGSGSEREDRHRKVIEYARTGIEQYWLVDFDPRPRIQIRRLEGSAYGDPILLEEKDILEVTDPFPISFPLSRLADFS
ncbi:Uma2 family endonuclease [Nocardia concava]|uniref:Uma2 family endonuclease n=1 Tax=Nocardia concava TaxID=257281 RepID=UPI0002E5F974|nr:Uma2 family endonuclease [Nocardia concava]